MASLLQLTVLLLCSAFLCYAAITDSCISCIGKVEGGSSGCNWDVNSLSCGRYQIKEPYWIDCGRPGGSWQGCASTESCSIQCIKAYMNRYEATCKRHLGKSSLTCYDYGRLHNGGPSGCSYSSTLTYVSHMKRYC